MTDFYRKTRVKAVRKQHRCDGCCKPIEVGSPALRYSGKFDGQFGSFVHHPECRDAERALNKLHDLGFYDDWMPLNEIESDDHEWLLAEYPAVAERFGITADTIRADAEERERSRVFWAEQDRRRYEQSRAAPLQSDALTPEGEL